MSNPINTPHSAVIFGETEMTEQRKNEHAKQERKYHRQHAIELAIRLGNIADAAGLVKQAKVIESYIVSDDDTTA